MVRRSRAGLEFGEWPIWTLILVFLSALWIFGILAFGVKNGEIFDFDRSVLLAMRSPGDFSDPIGPTWFEETIRDITSLGSIPVLAILVCSVSGYLLLQRKKSAALWLFFVASTGLILSTYLKIGFDRARPDLTPHAATVFTASFPSGHALSASVVYLTLGAMLARAEPKRRLKFYLLTIAFCLTVLVGTSRIYLGVHWPSDVLAGWTFGAAWAILFWLLTMYLQHKGQVET